MATIERRYLPPLNPDTTITETDRDHVYNIVRKQLATILEGDDSYYPEGVQKSLLERADDLKRLIGSIASLQGRVNDPANILGDVVGHLNAYARKFDDQIKSAEPTDPIEIAPDQFPSTRDRNELYLEPNPIAPPMEKLPHPRQEWTVSTTSRRVGKTRPEWRIAPPIFFPF